jgi:hypothetical protein
MATMAELLDPPDGSSIKPDGSSIRMVELLWPHKDQDVRPVQADDGTWALHLTDQSRTLHGLSSISAHGNPSDDNIGLIVVGDRLEALEALRRSLHHSARLAFVDLPRIVVDDKDAAFRAAGEDIYSTWMSVVRSQVAGVLPLLSQRGVIVVLTSDDEQAFARLICDELLGRDHHLATVVWQKRYAPLNMRGMKEFTTAHDYLFAYAVNKEALPPVGLRTAPSGFTNRDDDPRGPWKAEHKGAATRRESTDFDTFVPPYRWAIVGGRLPHGVWRLSPLSGVIFGERVEELGDFPVTVEASDSKGNTARRSLVLHVSAVGATPPLAKVPWCFDEIPVMGGLRVATEQLPEGVLGERFSAVLEAEGGTPFRDEPKRPSAPRYWEYSKSTLADAYAEDKVDFGAKGNSIPKIKRYLTEVGDVAVTNQISWWPGRDSKKGVFAGYTQDATRHLRSMIEAGLIKRAPGTAKPEYLMARLLDIFTDYGDLIVELGGDSGDLCAVATKRGRRWVALRSDDHRSALLTADCVVPRLTAVTMGAEEKAQSEGVAVSIPYQGGGQFNVTRVGPWLASRAVDDDLIHLNSDLDDDQLAEAVLTANGFLPASSGGIAHGIELYGDSHAVFVPPGEFLGPELIADLVSELRPTADRRLTVFYFRSDDDLDIASLPISVICRRVPYELGL